jgi:hypothetical protein
VALDSLDGLVEPLREPARALLALYPGTQLTSARRSRAQQARLYRRFLAGASRFPALPPGYSMHEYGLAFDAWNPDPEIQRALGRAWVAAGGRWGGERDPVHFEAPREWRPYFGAPLYTGVSI